MGFRLVGSESSTKPTNMELTHLLASKESSPHITMSNCLLPEQELSVKICQVYGVHVNNVDISKTGNYQVLKHFAPKTTSSDNQDT
ncbi:hypothetical protein AYI68_g3492 [Smittium mucronatum]|uniref:Uncharacterized protein n=1 Tax=Smittium mucronatum TaxID=133383 RepID=A0A1R0GZU2_9FUNG|nr:hypothetical protein AYI68_g3492 [Smittium mucronatum]